MAKAELDRVLEKTVADALGVSLPMHRRMRATPKVRHHAKAAPKRARHIVRELHPA